MEENTSNIEETKHCPYCDEIIRANAIKCKHCGSELTDTRVPTSEITPENQVRLALGNKYEIFEEIGRGGMATVYKAVQKNLNRLVALKVIHKNLVFHQDFLERFHREAQLSASLSHTNIVTIYDEGSVNGVNYIAMEYLEGSDLHSYIQDKGRLQIEEAINIIAPIAEALDYAHNKGIVHRDIKSSNIIITATGRAVLTDFGIAHAATETKLTQTGVVIGTPEYMSPEQAISGQVDAQSDLYSLGVVLYECITGDLPFKGETPISTIYKIVNNKVESITKTVPNAPRWLTSIINKILAKNKKNRFKSGKEFSRALRAKQEQVNTIQLSEDETIVLTKDKFQEIEKQFRPQKQKKILLFSGTGAIIILIIGYLVFSNGGLSIFNRSENNNAPKSLNDFEKKRVELLLAEGDLLLKENSLVKPPDRNAAERYQEVLKIQNKNPHAEGQLQLIKDKLNQIIKQQLNENRNNEAKDLALLARQYFPSEDSFIRLTNQINVGELEHKAAALIDQDPMEAFNVCKEIQTIDADNNYIKSALPEIRSRLISRADNEFANRNFKEAADLYGKIKSLFGTDSDLDQRISRSNSEVKKANMMNNADREFRRKNFSEALNQYLAIRSMFGKDKFIEQRIAKCNSEIETSSKAQIPNLIGLTLQDAEVQLSKAGLNKGKVSEILSEKNKGKVITQIPKAGAAAQKGTEVKLFIGK